MARGEEHLSNTPKQQLLWEALGQEPPVWAHLPILVNEKRQKLSKRRDKVALEDFRDEGYLAEAMRNYLMLLGWAPRGDREIVPWDEIVAEFRLEDVNPSPAFFDVKKLRAFNGEYIRALAGRTSSSRPASPGWQPPAAPWPAERFDPAVFARAGAAGPDPGQRCCPRSRPMVDFAFLAEPAVDEASWAKAMKEPAAADPGRRATAYAVVPWQADDATGSPGDDRDQLRAVARQGAGAGPGGGDRPHGRPAAVRVARGAGPGADAVRIERARERLTGLA